jgi:hypothetical protein
MQIQLPSSPLNCRSTFIPAPPPVRRQPWMTRRKPPRGSGPLTIGAAIALVLLLFDLLAAPAQGPLLVRMGSELTGGFADSTQTSEKSGAGIKVLASCRVGGPQQAAFDPSNGFVYVVSFEPNIVTILKSPCTIVKVLHLPPGGEPFNGAYDPTTGEMYVTDIVLGQVYVIRGTNLVATIRSTSFSGASGIAFDPFTGTMLVAGFYSNEFASISGDKVVATFSGVGTTCDEPVALLVTPNDRVFASTLGTNFESGGLCIFSATSYLWLANLTQSCASFESIWDPEVGEVISDNSGCGYTVYDLLEVNPTTYHVTHRFSVPVEYGFGGLAYSGKTESLYATGNSDVWVLAPDGVFHPFRVHENLGGSYGADGITYDPLNGDMYLCGTYSNTVYVLS